jgi:hypothetical protein
LAALLVLSLAVLQRAMQVVPWRALLWGLQQAQWWVQLPPRAAGTILIMDVCASAEPLKLNKRKAPFFRAFLISMYDVT